MSDPGRAVRPAAATACDHKHMSKNFDTDLELRAREAMAGTYNQAAARGDVPLSLHKMIAAVFRSRYLLFAFACIGFLIGTFLAVVTPNNYVSSGKFMFTGSGSESVTIEQTGVAERQSDTISQNAFYLFTANDLLWRVAKTLSPAKILKPYRPEGAGGGLLSGLFHSLQREYSDTAEEGWTLPEAVKRLQRTITVEQPHGTNVLLVSAAANDPELAQEILGAYMHEAVQFHLEIYDDPKVYDEYKRRAQEAETAVEAARTEQRLFLEKADVRDFLLELRNARELFLAQQNDLDDNERQLESTKSQIEELKANLKSPEMSPTQVVMSRPDFSQQLQQFATQIGELNTRLIRVKAQAPATGPMPKDIQGQIDELERQISMTRQQEADAKRQAAEAKEVETVVENPRRRDADARMSTLSLEVTQLQTDGDVLRKQFEKTKALYVRLNSLENRYDEVVRTLARADEDRRRSADALANANMRRELKQGSFSSLQQFEAPSLPAEKEGPNRTKLVFGGLLAGLFLGLGVVLLRTVPDSVIRGRDDIEGLDGVAVIGVLPRLNNRNLRRHRALREQGW